MTIVRMIAVAFVFLIFSAGWYVLGFVTESRSESQDEINYQRVGNLWGPRLKQNAPRFVVKRAYGDNVVESRLKTSGTEVKVSLALEHRRKGMIWYPTYQCDFDGIWLVSNPSADSVASVDFNYSFPGAGGTYDRFKLVIDGADLDVHVDPRQEVTGTFDIQPGETRSFRVTYRTRGLEQWTYDIREGRVRNINVVVTTDFPAYDFPEGALSPMEQDVSGNGAEIRWQATDLITSQPISVTLPQKLNPGPLSASMTFFAPICLGFFFVLILTIQVVYGTSVHPMHYLFIAAGFFAFHLLFAYLVDHLNVHVSFAISAATAVVLVTVYLWSALNRKLSWVLAAAGQLFYLVLFSYTFFLKGMTGLTVTIGSVVTLAILMKVTSHINWEAVFAGRNQG